MQTYYTWILFRVGAQGEIMLKCIVIIQRQTKEEGQSHSGPFTSEMIQPPDPISRSENFWFFKILKAYQHSAVLLL